MVAARMSNALDGTVALITGASSGIGAATAEHLADLGATVVLCARRKDRIDGLAARIIAADGRAVAIECDVSVESDADRAVKQAVDTLGRVDVVVANAGVMLLGSILDAPTEEWRRMIDVNVLGMMYTARASLSALLSAATQEPRHVADLVLLSSVAGRVARLGSGAYNASKHAVGAFGEALRQEVTAEHVRVSLVEPGAVDTELAGHNRPEIQEGLAERFATMQRLAAADIARSIAFVVTQPRHVAINEILIRPTDQLQ
jgi:NADP-dependent 3-hydroxy acid dehydrogenase YdfG